MTTTTTRLPSPKLVLGAADHLQLVELANAGLDSNPQVAEELLDELERAEIRSDEAVPADTVRMGSRVTYSSGDGAEREVTLVYPADADIAEGRISVLTPVGTALIGLRTGQSMDWTTRDGRRQVLTVLDVRQD